MKRTPSVRTTDPELVAMEKCRRALSARRIKYDFWSKAEALLYAAKRANCTDNLVDLLKRRGYIQ